MGTLAILLFVAASGIQLFFWGFLLRKWPAPMAVPTFTKPVSVIICAHNEAFNLQQNLPHFLRQDYPDFEIIVVDDHSTDDSADVVRRLSKQHHQLRLLSLSQPSGPGKKEALAAGIAAANADFLLLSDADCQPLSPQWIQTMMNGFRDGTELVLGFSPYQKLPGLLNACIRFEALYTALQYISLAAAGLPYMGVGRNLAYRKSFFIGAGGFRQHAHIASGDDDLLVNAAAKRRNTCIVVSPAAWVASTPKVRWRDYFRQKQRHLSTATHYRPLHQLVLGALSGSHFLHFAAAVPAWLSGLPAAWILSLMLLRGLFLFLTWKRTLHRLAQSDLLPHIFLLDFLFLLFYLVFAPSLFFSKRNSW
jgi:cellulose synthase/poly-beta-1,6-N-acetylglucosamine synthase-like glycosyltransferase